MTQERKRKRSTLTNVGDVLNTIVTKLGLDRRLREQTLMNLWPIVAGNTFALNTRPLFVDYENNLVVAVRDASVAQELSFLKRQITNKLKIAGKSAGIRIEGLRFDLKHFHQPNETEKLGDRIVTSDDAIGGEAPPVAFLANVPDEKLLKEQTLSEEEINQIAELKSQITYNAKLFIDHGDEAAVDALAERIARIAERELRLKKWQQSNGFPICQSCALPSSRLHTSLGLCSYCYLKQNADQP